MKRRTLLISIGGAAGTAGVIGTGAFTSVEADRDVSVTVANENNAYLGIEPSPSSSANSEFATQDSSNANEIALNFEDSGNGGSGVGLSSVYDFDDVFRITNQGTQTIYVWANFSNGDLSDDDIWFYPDGESSRRLNDGDNSVVTVPVGETVKMGVHIDTNVLESDDGDQTLTATLTADVDVPTNSSPSDGVGEDAAVVSKNSDDGEYSSIQSAIDAVDGTTVLVESGTYEESVTIDVEGLTLKAAGDASPTIDAGDTRNNIQADNVTVDGLSVVFENQGIYVESPADNVTIQNSEFSLPADVEESTGYAIRYEGSTSDGEVRNNEFVGVTNTQSQEFGNGVIISGPDGHEVVENTFDGNSIGVNVGSQQPAGELLVSDNTFTSQDDFAVALNHDDSESPSITISSNDFDTNSTGVLALSGGDIDISNNEFDAVGEEGETYVFDPNDAVDLDTVETENSFPGPAPVTGKVAINPNQPSAYNFNDDDGGTITRGGAAVEKTDGTLVVLPEGQDSKLNQFDSDATLLYVSNNAGIVNANAQAAPERENPAVYGYNLDGKGDALPAGEFEGTAGSDAPLPETGTNYQIEDYDILQGQLVIYWVTQEGEPVDPE